MSALTVTSDSLQRDPPRFPTRHPLGVWPQIHADPLAFLTDASRRHGDTVAFRIGPFQAVLLRHPMR